MNKRPDVMVIAVSPDHQDSYPDEALWLAEALRKVGLLARCGWSLVQTNPNLIILDPDPMIANWRETLTGYGIKLDPGAKLVAATPDRTDSGESDEKAISYLERGFDAVVDEVRPWQNRELFDHIAELFQR